MSITTYNKCTENFGKFVNIMKPVKKTNEGAKKKDLSNNGNNKKIPNYFQSQSIPIIGDNEIINEFQNTKPLYIKALKETLESKNFHFVLFPILRRCFFSATISIPIAICAFHDVDIFPYLNLLNIQKHCLISLTLPNLDLLRKCLHGTIFQALL